MDLTVELIKAIANGGVAIVVFVIWYKTFDTQTKQYTELINKLFNQIEEDIKYKELLTGILNRLEMKIDRGKKNDQ
jgi:hypothetical protein